MACGAIFQVEMGSKSTPISHIQIGIDAAALYGLRREDHCASSRWWPSQLL
jgi:hypothetical protein